jgi:hypothetical protein
MTEASLPPIEELTILPPGDPQATVDEIRHQLGIGIPRRRYQPPDLHRLDPHDEEGTFYD